MANTREISNLNSVNLQRRLRKQQQINLEERIQELEAKVATLIAQQSSNT